MARKNLTSRRWFYPVTYGMLIVISMLPPIAQVPYDPRNTQDVIMNILMGSIAPYQAWGWVFHVATLAVIALAIFRPQIAGRVMAAYFGVNYLIIAALQTNAVTEKYGFAVQTGALIAMALLGALWLWVAWRDKLQASFKRIPPWRWTLLPLALLVFWSPVGLEGNKVVPNFDPLLLLTSPDYGLTYCFATPVFLFLLILFYPRVDVFAFRVTAFNGLLYGLLNLTDWFNPDLVWMGVMHIPLLVIPLVALFVPVLERNTRGDPGS
jgi:drug/metabolite transporter superfamily protein YnfA